MSRLTEKVVFIGHPLGGVVEANIRRVLEICRAVHTTQHGTIPVAPYVVCCQYLRDGLEEERRLGMEVDHAHLRRRFVDELWLYGTRISEGMLEEVEICEMLGIPVVPKTEATRKAMSERRGGLTTDRASTPGASPSAKSHGHPSGAR